jgi:glutamate--cysteine ligase
MSLDLTGSEQLSRPIQSIDELVAWLRGGEKPEAQWLIGVEHEKLGLSGTELSAVPYGGPRGIRSLLESMSVLSGGVQKVHAEEGNPIALLSPDGSSVTLEPGGQLELSGAPARGLAQVEDEIDRHLA